MGCNSFRSLQTVGWRFCASGSSAHSSHHSEWCFLLLRTSADFFPPYFKSRDKWLVKLLLQFVLLVGGAGCVSCPCPPPFWPRGRDVPHWSAPTLSPNNSSTLGCSWRQIPASGSSGWALLILTSPRAKRHATRI